MDDFLNAMRDDTILVTLMTANNESGSLQPVKEVADLCRMKGILFHTDAAQAVGKVSISFDDSGIGSGVDMVTIVGHKVRVYTHTSLFVIFLSHISFPLI